MTVNIVSPDKSCIFTNAYKRLCVVFQILSNFPWEIIQFWKDNWAESTYVSIYEWVSYNVQVNFPFCSGWVYTLFRNISSFEYIMSFIFRQWFLGFLFAEVEINSCDQLWVILNVERCIDPKISKDESWRLSGQWLDIWPVHMQSLVIYWKGQVYWPMRLR